MQLPFFYEETISPAEHLFTLSEETSKHCVQVLRMKNGEQLQLTNGNGCLYLAAITEADKKHCVVVIEQERPEEIRKRKVSVAISLLKNAHRFEWFLEKAAELGVTEIVPLLCERTERQQFRQDRMKNILVSAMIQSRQVWLPDLLPPQPFDTVVRSSGYAQKLIAHCGDEGEKVSIVSVSRQNDIQILIGPEGDFTAKEIETALRHQYLPVSLGATRLRTETAGVVAATILINC